MDPLRTASLWLGVGAGHAAVLVAVWGSAPGGSPSAVADAGLLTVSLVSAAAPEPAAIPASPPPASPGELAPVSKSAQLSVKIAPAARAEGPAIAQPLAVAGEPPDFLERAEPLYPRGARLAGIEGVVRLRLEVAADGSLRRVGLAASSGDGALDRAAESAARASTYRPARVGGRAVDAEVEASYRFELR